MIVCNILHPSICVLMIHKHIPTRYKDLENFVSSQLLYDNSFWLFKIIVLKREHFPSHYDTMYKICLLQLLFQAHLVLGHIVIIEIKPFQVTKKLAYCLS